MKKIKIAQIGADHDHAPATYKCLTKLTDIFEFVGVAYVDGKNCKKLEGNPTEYTVEELLDMNDLDAVAIECAEERATMYAQIFAEKGIAIQLDKPGTANLESFEKLIETCTKNNSVLHLGYMYRYNPIVQKILKMVKSGELGDVFSVEAQMSVRHDDEKRAWLGKYKGGMMYYLGCHLVDLVLQICGDPEEIIPLNKCTGTNGVNAEDYGFAVFKYKNGCSFIKTNAAEYGGYNRRQLVVSGTKGTIEVKPFEIAFNPQDMLTSKYTSILEKDNPNNWGVNILENHTEPFDRYDTMMTEFAAYVRGEKENPYTYDYELKLFKTLMKVI